MRYFIKLTYPDGRIIRVNNMLIVKIDGIIGSEKISSQIHTMDGNTFSVKETYEEIERLSEKAQLFKSFTFDDNNPK